MRAPRGGGRTRHPGALPGSFGGGSNTEITCEEIASSAAARTQRGHNRGEEGEWQEAAPSAQQQRRLHGSAPQPPEQATSWDSVHREDKGRGHVSRLENANALSVAYSYSP